MTGAWDVRQSRLEWLKVLALAHISSEQLKALWRMPRLLPRGFDAGEPNPLHGVHREDALNVNGGNAWKHLREAEVG